MNAGAPDPLGRGHWPGDRAGRDRLLKENKHPEHGYRTCLGLSQAKRHSEPRLEAACRLALQVGACQYRHVRDILPNNRGLHVPAQGGDWVSPNHAHVRGATYFQ